MAGKILVIGADGQVGRACISLLGPSGVGLPREACDLGILDGLRSRLEDAVRQHGLFGAVINTAAYTQVDQAESDSAKAEVVNAVAPGMVAAFCKERSIPFVHYSTDYVYPGTGERPWREEDATGPQNAYGRTKLNGDRNVAEVGGDWMVLRTSWVYDDQGKNFVNTMLKLGAEREQLKVVADQIGAPTYALDLARTTLAMLEKSRTFFAFPSGVYHVCGAGETSWHGFATEIFREARARGWPMKVREVAPIASDEFPTPARRPRNSRMSLEKIKTVFGLEMPAWQDALKRCLDVKNASH